MVSFYWAFTGSKWLQSCCLILTSDMNDAIDNRSCVSGPTESAECDSFRYLTPNCSWHLTILNTQLNRRTNSVHNVPNRVKWNHTPRPIRRVASQLKPLMKLPKFDIEKCNKTPMDLVAFSWLLACLDNYKDLYRVTIVGSFLELNGSTTTWQTDETVWYIVFSLHSSHKMKFFVVYWFHFRPEEHALECASI